MNLGNLKLRHLLLLVAICFVFAVVFLAFLPSFSGGEEFSELWVLGPNRTVEEYPVAIMVGESHTLHLVITSHVPSGGEYLVNVKLRNQVTDFEVDLHFCSQFSSVSVPPFLDDHHPTLPPLEPSFSLVLRL